MMLPPSCGFEPMTYGLQSSASVCLPSVPPRTVTKVRLRGTSLTSPAAIACLTASKPAGKDNAPAKATLDSMKSRRVGSRPQMWLSIPIPFCLRLPDLARHGPSPGVRLPITLRWRDPPHDQQSKQSGAKPTAVSKDGQFRCSATSAERTSTVGLDVGAAVCTENLSSGVVVVKSAKDGV